MKTFFMSVKVSKSRIHENQMNIPVMLPKNQKLKDGSNSAL